MKNILYPLLFLLMVLPIGISAQISQGGFPASNRYQLSAEVPVQEMPSINVNRLLEEDEEDLKSNLPLRFAFGHQVRFNLENSGVWENLPNGDRVWRLGIHCPDALNINFLYSDFYLPKGAKLYVYNEDKSQVLGAFTAANNKESRRFATALIHDDVAYLEYIEPGHVRGKGTIELAQVGHGYRDMDGRTAESRAGACQVNINCSPEGDNWQDEKKGVARIVMDGLFLCSGSLINNTANDCKPYFLTANHCIMGGIPQDAILNPDVSGYIFYWNYEFIGCAEAGPLPEQTTNGGTILANTGIAQEIMHTLIGSDFALIELDENPRNVYDVYFNGFDATGDQGNTGVGIHHPAGDDKKISTHSKVPDDNGYYWDLFWDPTPNGYSVTEGGSSGSPLFRENSRILGQLFGGGSVNCDDPANDLAKYGKLSYSWTNEDVLDSFDPRRRLDVWLDPIGGGSIRTMEGAYDPCEVPKVYFKSESTLAPEEDANITDGCIAYSDYIFALGITPFPSNPVEVTLNAIGSAEEGENMDYEFFPSKVTFNNITNEQTVTIRVYNDDNVEADLENVVFDYTINGQSAASLVPVDRHTLVIVDDDEGPSGQHVQSVRNNDNPTTAYLGPQNTVFFFDLANDGVMMKIENLSNHDFGCTEVAVDNAGATANNSYDTGSASSKTFTVRPDFASANAQVRVTLYYTNSEVIGYEWFNNQGDNRNDLEVIRFEGTASPANEMSAMSSSTNRGSYGMNHTFAATFSGLSNLSGFTVGNLETTLQNLNMQLSNTTIADYQLMVSPNPVRNILNLQFESDAESRGSIRVVDGFGKVIFEQQQALLEGTNRFEITVDEYTPGVYFIQVVTENGTLGVKKFIKS